MEPNYKARAHALFKCARAAREKKFQLFGLENGGQCFGSDGGETAFRKYGSSTSCRGRTRVQHEREKLAEKERYCGSVADEH